MTTAIIGTGGIGSAIARLLAAGGESLRLASADAESARSLAARLGPPATVAAGNRDALDGATAVVLALRFTVLTSVIDEIAGALADRVVVVPSNPLTTDAHGAVVRVLPDGQSSGEVLTGWLPPHAHLAMAFGSMSADRLAAASRRTPEPAVMFYAAGDSRAAQEAGGDYDGRVRAPSDRRERAIRPARSRRRPPRCCREPGRGDRAGRSGLNILQIRQQGRVRRLPAERLPGVRAGGRLIGSEDRAERAEGVR